MTQPGKPVFAAPASLMGASSCPAIQEDGSSPWVPKPSWEMQKNIIAPGYGSAQLQLLQPIQGVNQWMGNCSLSHLLSVTLSFKYNRINFI